MRKDWPCREHLDHLKDSSGAWQSPEAFVFQRFLFVRRTSSAWQMAEPSESRLHTLAGQELTTLNCSCGRPRRTEDSGKPWPQSLPKVIGLPLSSHLDQHPTGSELPHAHPFLAVLSSVRASSKPLESLPKTVSMSLASPLPPPRLWMRVPPSPAEMVPWLPHQH